MAKGRQQMRAGWRGGPMRKGGRRKASQLGPGAREALALARRQTQAGEHRAAAAIYAELAGNASGRELHGLATHLQLQAAAALHRAGDADAALAAATEALELSAQHPDRPKAARKLGVVVGTLRDAGHETAADALEAAALERFGLTRLPRRNAPANVNRAMRRGLPRACPTCAAPIDAKGVEFEEDGSADCPTCGEVLTG